MQLAAQDISITPSEVIEYLYCPRFIYYMNCLCIPQHEEQRYKVQKGREIHEIKGKVNRDYLRKKLGCIKKEGSVYLASSRYHLRGVIDEVLFLNDGTLAPIDYKYAEYNERLYQTYKIQSILYGLLIKENYKREVNRGYICYVRSRNLIKELSMSSNDFDDAIDMVNDILRII